MEINVCIVELPGNVHGVSTLEEEKYTIYINANDSIPDKLMTYFRGFARAEYGHFKSDKPYWACDTEAHMFAQVECQKLDEVSNAPPHL